MNHDFGRLFTIRHWIVSPVFRCSRLDHDFPGCVICRFGRCCIVSTPLLAAEWNSVNHWEDAPGWLSNLHLRTNSQVGLDIEWFREQASSGSKYREGPGTTLQPPLFYVCFAGPWCTSVRRYWHLVTRMEVTLAGMDWVRVTPTNSPRSSLDWSDKTLLPS